MKTKATKLDAAGRAKIVAAMKARWAARKNGKTTKPAKAAAKPAKSKASKSTKGQGSAAARTDEPAAPDRYGQQYSTEDITLPLAALVADLNYRTQFHDEPLDDLIGSLKEHGIRERLWVRPLDKPTGKHTHEIIAGERRWRAAQQTTLLVAPVTIYHCTREEALALNLIENLQREDTDEIDEAAGFKRLIAECGYSAWNPEDPAHSVAHKVGKKKSHVYGMLKLADLPKLGVQAIRGGKLSASVAIRIARIPNQEMQMQALKQAIDFHWTDSRAAEEIARRYMTELKGAPFDLEDPSLNPERPSCARCPFRSGNQAEMFGDLAKGRGDICLDPQCFKLKCDRTFDKKADVHEEAGGRVLSRRQAEEAGLGKYYTQLSGKYADLSRQTLGSHSLKKPLRTLLKAALEEDPSLVILARSNDGDDRTFELIETESALRLLKAAGHLDAKARAGGASDSSRDEARKAKLEAERAKAITRWQLGMINGKALQFAQSTGFAECPRDDRAIQLMTGIADWLIEDRGVDALRLVCVRRQINPKDFKLDAGMDTPAARMQSGLRSFLKGASSCEVIALIMEIMATPGFPHRDGTLDDDRAGIVSELLGLKPDDLHVAAKTAVDDELKTKLGKKQGELL